MQDSIPIISDSLMMLETFNIQAEVKNALNGALNTQFFQGGALLAIIGWMSMQFKGTILSLYERIARLIKFQMYFDETNPSVYDAFVKWYIDKFPEKYRNVQVKIEEDSNKPIRERFTFIISQFEDRNWLFYKRRLIFISKSRETLENSSSYYSRHLSSYKIWGFFAKKAILSLLDELKEKVISLEETRLGKKIYYNSGTKFDDWNTKRVENYKSFDRLYFNSKQELLNDLDNFAKNKELYNNLGLSNKRGYAFEGPPGNGKSSGAIAVADYLGMELYYINLGSFSNDGDLHECFCDIKDNSVLVFEDIDAFTTARMGDDPDKTGINFASLLQVLSGVFEPTNCIIIMTTNHYDKLDPALVRSGRIDKCITFGNPSEKIAGEFVNMFYKIDSDLNSEEIINYSMADVQNMCLENLNDPQIVIESIKMKKDE